MIVIEGEGVDTGKKVDDWQYRIIGLGRWVVGQANYNMRKIG